MQRTLSKALTAPQPQERPPSSAGGCKASSEARVLVINTGGTIGMVQDDKDRAAEQLEYLFKNIWQSLVSRQKPVKGPGKGSMLKKLNK